MAENEHRYQPIPWPGLPAHDADAMIARPRALYEQVRTRRTCRFFSDAPVPREVIEQALLAAGLATLTHTPNPMSFLNRCAAARAMKSR